MSYDSNIKSSIKQQDSHLGHKNNTPEDSFLFDSVGEKQIVNNSIVNKGIMKKESFSISENGLKSNSRFDLSDQRLSNDFQRENPNSITCPNCQNKFMMIIEETKSHLNSIFDNKNSILSDMEECNIEEKVKSHSLQIRQSIKNTSLHNSTLFSKYNPRKYELLLNN